MATRWQRLAKKAEHLWQKLVDSHFVRMMRLGVHTVSLPGNKGVPVYEVARYLWRGIFNGDLWRASKGLAFSFLTALPPLLIFVFTLIAFLPVDGLQNELLYELQLIIPEKIYNPVANTINDVMGHKHTSLLSIGFITSVVLAANAINGMINYFSDRHTESRTFVRQYPLCILLVFLLYIMLVLVLSLLIGYKSILVWLFRYGILTRGSFTHIVISIGRWVILVGMALVTLSLIYYIIPMKKQRVGFFSAGAMFATLMFIILSWGFKIYLANFNRYNLLYGSIGTLLVVMLWLLLNCFVIMLGYELNTAILNGKIKGYTVRHRLRNFRLRTDGMADPMYKPSIPDKTTNNP